MIITANEHSRSIEAVDVDQLEGEELGTIVVTSINAPTDCLRAFAKGALEHGTNLIVVGDRKSPPDFSLLGAEYIDIDVQSQRFPRFAKLLPLNSYSRKNIGYLAAMSAGASLIVETDDDNAPLPGFWARPDRTVRGQLVQRDGWVNAYKYFSPQLIWPRGLPLDEVNAPASHPAPGPESAYHCPVQQGLADRNPDVDAVYRLLLPLPVSFETGPAVVLARGAWCPFNSQNTKWWPEVFPLLYLPAYCSFRMTDIWRSFVVQRIMWENGWHVSFHSSTVYQHRNDHNLMKDFEDEVPGYLNNAKIRDVLTALELRGGLSRHGQNLRLCYEALVGMEVIGPEEIPLLNAWIAEVEALA